MGVGGTSSGPGVRSGSSGDDYRTAGKMRGTRTRARRGRAGHRLRQIQNHRQSARTRSRTLTAPPWAPPVRRRGPTPRPPLSPAHPGASRRPCRRHTHSQLRHIATWDTLALLRVLCSCDVVLCCGLSRRVVTGNSTGTPGILAGHTVSSIHARLRYNVCSMYNFPPL